MPEPQIRYLSQSALTWRVLYWMNRPFVSKALVGRDVHRRSREQIMTASTDECFGPEASIEGRDHGTNALAVGAPVTVTVAWIALAAVALVVREAGYPEATGSLLTAGWLIILPIAGLTGPWAWRFWWARRQLKDWTARGKPEHERPIDRSLPRGRDTVVGLLLGGVADVLVILAGGL